MRLLSVVLAGVSVLAPAGARTQTSLPDAPSTVLLATNDSSAALPVTDAAAGSSSRFPAVMEDAGTSLLLSDAAAQSDTHGEPARTQRPCAHDANVEVDRDCQPIPLDRQQPKRILGFMPNFRSVSAGAVVHPPGWKYNFTVATKQAFDYSSFIFLGITSAAAYGIDSHPSLDTGDAPFWAYLWRGFLDKTDGNYLGAWLLPSLLHQDTRYYPMGTGHPIVIRALYVMSRQVVTRTYGGRQTFNLSGLGAKVLTQYISRFYYPPNSSPFSVLATKFAYAAMRDIAFTSIREFYPDIAAHYVRKHRAKALERASHDASATAPPSAPPLRPALQY